MLLRKHKKVGGVNIFTKQVSAHVKTMHARYIISMLLNYTQVQTGYYFFIQLMVIKDTNVLILLSKTFMNIAIDGISTL